MGTPVGFGWSGRDRVRAVLAVGIGVTVAIRGSPARWQVPRRRPPGTIAGVLPASKLRSWWRWIVIGVMVFAAMATPTGDPFNLMVLALPLLALMGLAWMVARLNDRRRARRAKDEPQWDDDETSPLDYEPSSVDDLDETAPRAE